MITCNICNLSFKAITNSHLRDKHNTTSLEYLSKFPNSPLTSQETLKLRSVAFKGKTYEEIQGEGPAKVLKELRRQKALDQFKDETQKIIRKLANWKGFGEIPGTLWGSYKRGARIRGFSFDITIEYAWNLYLSQQKTCALSGVPISIDTTVGILNKHDGKNTTASLDRIDSLKGYEKGNVQWIHKDINRLKMAWPEDYFLEMCTNIINHHNNR